MKRLFKDKEPEVEGSLSTFSLASYNFNNLPNITVMHNRDPGEMAAAFRGLPSLPFGLVVLHCYKSPLPSQVAMLYELRRVVVERDTPICLFHHRGGKIEKKWRLSMRLMGFSPRSSDGFVSIWGGPDDFKTPRCKTKVALEKQPSRFYRTLLRGTKRVLEVFPRVGTVSKTALSLRIPVTVFISGEGTSTKALVKRLGGSFE